MNLGLPHCRQMLYHLSHQDLNQIPNVYSVEVTNRLKGLDLIDRVPEKLWMEVHNIVHEAVTKIIPKKQKSKKGKVVV